jgi:hypothetical protein
MTDNALVAGEFLKQAGGVEDVYDSDLGLTP